MSVPGPCRRNLRLLRREAVPGYLLDRSAVPRVDLHRLTVEHADIARRIDGHVVRSLKVLVVVGRLVESPEIRFTIACTTT